MVDPERPIVWGVFAPATMIVISVVGFFVNTPSSGGTAAMRHADLACFLVAVFVAVFLGVAVRVRSAIGISSIDRLKVAFGVLVFGVGMLVVYSVFAYFAWRALSAGQYSAIGSDRAGILIQFGLILTWNLSATIIFIHRRNVLGVDLNGRDLRKRRGHAPV